MQKIDLSILPQGTINPIIRCSQGDVGRQFQVELYNEDMSAKYVLDGTETLTVEGHKPDGNFFSYDLPATTGSVITVTTQEQMTACYGDVYGEIRIAKGDTLLGTANFTLSVEIGASAQDTVSISALQFIDALRNEMHEAVDDAEDYADDSKAWAVGPNGSGTGTDTNNSKYYSEQSSNSATASANSADDSKAWAVGPNGSGSGTDSNNSKYYSQQASSSASSASSSASDAKNWAVGPSGSGSGTDSNNAKHYSEQSANSATDASGYATNASNSADAASGSASDAKNWAVGPSGSGSGTDTNNSKYYAGQASQSATDADTAKDDAVSAKNAAESAQQKIENMTASASGLPAGSSPTVTKTEVGGVVNLDFGIPKGDKGDTGDDGISPSASVAQTDPDTITFTVTDRQGTTTATLSAGGAPSLAGCSDVNIQSPSDGQGLVYDGNSSKWVNGQAGVAPYNGNNGYYIEAGRLTFYNNNTESYDTTFDPLQFIDTSNSEPSWYMGIPVCLCVRKESEKVSGQWIANYCPLVASRIYWTGFGMTLESAGDPARCLYLIKKTAEDGEQGLAYNIDLYFLLPDNTGRLVKVTYVFNDYGVMQSNTMTYISLGGGGGSSATPGYVILGEVDSSDNYTPTNYSTILASAGNLNNLVIKQSFENSGYAILQPIGVQIDDVVAGTQIFEPASKVFTDLIGGAYSTSVIVFTILFNKIGAAAQVKQYYVQFVVDGSTLTLQANSLSVLTVGPSV